MCCVIRYDYIIMGVQVPAAGTGIIMISTMVGYISSILVRTRKKTKTCKSAEDFIRGRSKKKELRAGLEPLERSMVPSEY